MNLQSLRPASDFAKNYGVKAVVYGPPGSGKTPIVNTAPRPVLLACEPGLLSMRGSTVPTFTAFTADALDEFSKWIFHSNEAKNFDTVAIDSGTQMAETYLERAEKSNKHGLAAYGEANENTYDFLRRLYYMQNKHVYLICKQEMANQQGLFIKKPYFPGRELPVKVPHLFDLILQLDVQNVPSVGQTKAFRCIQSIDVTARNRTGNLNEFEPPDFGELVKKAMS